jgi:hypothetical protein
MLAQKIHLLQMNRENFLQNLSRCKIFLAFLTKWNFIGNIIEIVSKSGENFASGETTRK